MVIHLTEAMATILAGGTGSGTEVDTETYCSNQIREEGKKEEKYMYYMCFIDKLVLQILHFPAW